MYPVLPSLPAWCAGPPRGRGFPEPPPRHLLAPALSAVLPGAVLPGPPPRAGHVPVARRLQFHRHVLPELPRRLRHHVPEDEALPGEGRGARVRVCRAGPGGPWGSGHGIGRPHFPEQGWGSARCVSFRASCKRTETLRFQYVDRPTSIILKPAFFPRRTFQFCREATFPLRSHHGVSHSEAHPR